MRLLAPAAALIAAFALPAMAAEDDITFGARISTLGIGIETATQYPTERINLRAQLNFGAFDRDMDDTGFPFEGEVEFVNGALLADFFLVDQFRVSLGAIVNKNRIKLSQEGPGFYQIGTRRYRAEGDFRVGGETTFPSVAPYLGIGWGNPFGKDGRWSVGFDAGVMMTGDSESELDAEGTVTPVDGNGTPVGAPTNAANDPTFRADLRREQDEVAKEAEDYDFYPVIGVSLTYRY